MELGTDAGERGQKVSRTRMRRNLPDAAPRPAIAFLNQPLPENPLAHVKFTISPRAAIVTRGAALALPATGQPKYDRAPAETPSTANRPESAVDDAV